MRAQNLLNARQPAGEHRRVLGVVYFFVRVCRSDFQLIVKQITKQKMSNNNILFSQYIEKCQSLVVVFEEFSDISPVKIYELKKACQTVGSKKVLSSTKSSD